MFRFASFFFLSSLLLTASPVGSAPGEDGFTYQLAVPGRKFSFPADHYAHPDFQTEWWYYTGHLQTERGKSYGFQVTFFRFGVRDRQKKTAVQPPLFTELYMAHFALSDITAKKLTFRERINRGIDGKAGAATDKYLVWNEDWSVEGDRRQHVIRVHERGIRLRLVVKSMKPPVLHGRDGLSQKGEGEGRASYYYSLTRMQTEGELIVNERKHSVRGLTWMDHEFGSNQLGPEQVGWDWFSIQLADRTELMLYIIRRKDGSPDPYSSGTLVKTDGSSRHIKLQEVHLEVLERWKSPKSGATYPIKWRVTIPSEQLELNIVPEFPDQELITNRSTRVTYWEGAARITGTLRRKPIAGAGYVEMTGYAGKVNI